MFFFFPISVIVYKRVFRHNPRESHSRISLGQNQRKSDLNVRSQWILLSSFTGIRIKIGDWIKACRWFRRRRSSVWWGLWLPTTTKRCVVVITATHDSWRRAFIFPVRASRIPGFTARGQLILFGWRCPIQKFHMNSPQTTGSESSPATVWVD
jgi:hypothetical protein